MCKMFVFLRAQIRKIRYATHKTVGHVLCQIFNHDISGWFPYKNLMILFPPAKYDCNTSVPLNIFALKAATSAVIVGHSSNHLEFLLTILSEHPHRHFRLSLN